MTYEPQPIDTSHIQFEKGLQDLIEELAKNTHDTWAQMRIAEGWQHGERYDDRAKTTPNLVPYAELPETEKDYDRATASETLKLVMALGYRIDTGQTK